jgi:threonine/homoserine efflux transporter RhtA
VRASVFPIWIFVAVAAVIAIVAFLAAQVKEGAGIIVALTGSTLWMAYVARKTAVERARHD